MSDEEYFTDIPEEYFGTDDDSEPEESDDIVHSELLNELDDPEKENVVAECAMSAPLEQPQSKKIPKTGDTVIDGVYYPAEGVFFRLCSYKTNLCIYARDHRSPAHGGHRRSDPCTDQFFQLGYDVERKTWFLRNMRTEKYLEAGSRNNDYISHTTTPGDKTQVCLAPASNAQYKGYYKIIFKNKDFEGMLTMSPELEGYYTVPTSRSEDERNYWSLLYEDLRFETVHWDRKSGIVGPARTVSLWSGSHYNEGPSVDETKVSETEVVEQSYEFVHLYGASIEIAAEAKVGVPLISQATISTKIGAHVRLQWGKRFTETKKYKIEQTVKWDVGHYRASIVTIKSVVDVPFTITYRTVANGKPVSVGGLWKGVVSGDTIRRKRKLPPPPPGDDD